MILKNLNSKIRFPAAERRGSIFSQNDVGVETQISTWRWFNLHLKLCADYGPIREEASSLFKYFLSFESILWCKASRSVTDSKYGSHWGHLHIPPFYLIGHLEHNQCIKWISADGLFLQCSGDKVARTLLQSDSHSGLQIETCCWNWDVFLCFTQREKVSNLCRLMNTVVHRVKPIHYNTQQNVMIIHRGPEVRVISSSDKTTQRHLLLWFLTFHSHVNKPVCEKYHWKQTVHFISKVIVNLLNFIDKLHVF